MANQGGEEVILNGESIDPTLLEQLKKDPTKRLKEVAKDKYKMLEKMHG